MRFGFISRAAGISVLYVFPGKRGAQRRRCPRSRHHAVRPSQAPDRCGSRRTTSRTETVGVQERRHAKYRRCQKRLRVNFPTTLCAYAANNFEGLRCPACEQLKSLRASLSHLSFSSGFTETTARDHINAAAQAPLFPNHCFRHEAIS